MEDEIREKIAKEIEETIEPLLKKPGLMNALGTYMLVMKIVKEGRL